jgi:uncharacterized protein
MKIDLDKIPPDGVQLDGTELPKILDISVEGVGFNDPIEVSIFAIKSGSTLIVKGGLKTKIDFKCGRCLKSFSSVVESKNLNYTYEVAGLNELDITEDLREEVLLLLPLRPLCKKECKGFCLKCGQDLNEKKCSCGKLKEDIRWSDLDKFKLKKEE